MKTGCQTRHWNKSVERQTISGAETKPLRWLTALLLAGACLQTSASAAQQAATTQSRTNAAFNIPAQSLSKALVQFSTTTGLQMFYSADLVRGKNSAGVSGPLTNSAALERLLAGSGLHFTISGKTVTITGTPNSANNAPATGEGIHLQTITVSGSVPAMDKVFETPGSTSYIGAEQIERIAPTSVGDIFKSAPGVIASGTRVGASADINIRGLQGQNRVNVMVDGTRQSNNSYRGYRGSRNETYVDPDFIGGIDITKGPSGGAGGTGAMGGVVNMRTINAADIVKDGQTYGARVKTALGSNTKTPLADNATNLRSDGPSFFNGDSWSGSAVGAVQEENYEFLAGLSRRKTGNYFAGKHGPTSYMDDTYTWMPPREMPISPIKPGREVPNTSQDVTSFLTKGKLKWDNNQSLELSYNFYKNNYGENNETDLGYIYWVPIQYPLSTTETHTFKSQYKYRPDDNELIDLTANLWATDVETRSDVVRRLTYNPDADGKARVRTYGGDIANISRFSTVLGEITMNNGAEFVLERAREKQIIVSGPGYSFYMGTNPNGNRTLLSAFNETRLDVNDWLSFSGGLRYDHFKTEGKGLEMSKYPEKQEGRLNPSISVTLTPVEGIQLFGAYVEGWRPPSLRETAAVPNMVPNPDLMPEISKNTEFGVNVKRDDLLAAGDSLRLKFARFDNNYNDYIVRGRDPKTTKYSWYNIEKANFSGYELSMGYDVGYGFVEGAFTRYDKIKLCDKGVCGGSVGANDYGIMSIPPKYSGTVTLGARLFEEKLTIGSRFYFFGERYGGSSIGKGGTNAATYWAQNTIVDLFGSYKFNDITSLDVSAENITNRYYLDPIATTALPSPGRTLRASLTAKF